MAETVRAVRLGDKPARKKIQKSVAMRKARGRCIGQSRKGVSDVWANYFKLVVLVSRLFPLCCAGVFLPGVIGDATKLCIITIGFSAEGIGSPG